MSSNHFGGNFQNEIILEEHDGINNAKRMTIGAVSVTVPTSFSGNVTLDSGSKTQIVGNMTLSDSKGFIGLVTNTPVGLTTVIQGTSPWSSSIVGNVTLSDSKGYIGLVTVTQASSSRSITGNITLSDSKGYIGLVSVAQPLSTTFSGNVTLDAGSKTQIVGNVTLSDSKTFIGLVTVGNTVNTSFSGNVTLDAGSKTQIVGNVTLSDPKTFIGSVSVGGIVDSKNYIGLVTNTIAAVDTKSFLGLVTVVQSSSARSITGNVTLSDSKTFIGSVTAWSRNAGTTKTLIPKTIAFAQGSIATIAVPSNTFYITQLILNSNATVRVNVKSGATYLTGNVSLGININPGGGWVQNGSPDSPVYIGLAGAAGIVVEKADSSGVVSQIGGHLIYFDE